MEFDEHYADEDVHELIDSIPFLRLEDIKVDGESKIVDINACSCTAYIFTNLLFMEMEKRPIPDYMETVQTQINKESRALCADLIIEAARIIHCEDSLPHFAVNCLDRYLSGNNVDFKSLCCLALTTLMIASAFDVHGDIPNYDYYAYKYLCEGMMISGPELANSAAPILAYLENDVMAPTAYTFLDRFVHAARCGRRRAPLRNLENMVLYVADVSLLSTTMLRFLPSMVAASSVLVAQYVLDPDTEPWNATLRHYTTYEASDLRDCVSALLDLFSDEGYYMPAVTEKFSSEEYGCVTLSTFPRSMPPHVFHTY